MKNILCLIISLITINSFSQIVTVNEKHNVTKTFNQKIISLIDINNKSEINPNNGVKLNSDNETITITDIKKFNTNFAKIKPQIVIDTTNAYTFDYHNLKRKSINDSIIIIKKMIKTKSKQVNTPEEIVALESKLQKKRGLLIEYDKLFDTLRSKAQRQLVAPANFSHWFPSSTRQLKYIFFNKFYGKSTQSDLFVGNNASIQINDSGTTVQSELISSYFGPFRVCFGTILANKTSSSESDTTTNRITEDATEESDSALEEGLQLLQSGGGNIYLNIDYPVYGTQTKFATFYSNLYGRASGVLTQMSNTIDSSTGNGCVGISIYGSVASEDRSLIGFLNFNFAGYGGGSEYYRSLNLTQNKLFAFGQLNIGIEFKNAFRLTYTPATFGSDESLRKISGTIGFQISSEMFKS